MDALKNQKQLARRELLARRRQVPKDILTTRSANLVAHVLASEFFRDAPTIVAFVGVRGEPLTDELLRATLEAGKQLVLPRVTDDRRNIAFYTLPALADLIPGTFGLREPPPDTPYDLRSDPQALLLIPGLGFTRDGCRLGFGKGHYDRALAPVANLRPPQRIGVCLHEALDPSGIELVRDDHDVVMHRVVTDQGIFVCTL